MAWCILRIWVELVFVNGTHHAHFDKISRANHHRYRRRGTLWFWYSWRPGGLFLSISRHLHEQPVNHTISFTPQLLYLALELNVLAIHCRAKKTKKKKRNHIPGGIWTLHCFCAVRERTKKKNNFGFADWEPFLVFYLSACLCAFQPPVWVATLITAQLCSIIPLRARGADWIRAPRHLWLRRQQRVCVPSVSTAATLNVAAPSSLGRTTDTEPGGERGWGGGGGLMGWRVLLLIRAGAVLGWK